MANFLKNKNSAYILILVLFFISILFSLSLFEIHNLLLKNFIVLAYVLFLGIEAICIYYAREYFSGNKLSKSNISYFVLLAIHTGLLIGFILSPHSNPASLWPPDAYMMHLPGSINIANFLHGTEPLRERLTSFDMIYVTHVLVGFSFYLFGVSPVSSAIILMLIKLCTLFFIKKIGNLVLDKEEIILSELFYVFMPTVIFYTLSFYKEATVHLVIAMFSYFLILFFKQERKLKSFIFIILAVALMINERFYLAVTFLATFGILYLSNLRLSVFIKIFSCSIIAIFLIILSSHFLETSPAELMKTLGKYRNAYMNYKDVNQSMNHLIYPLAFIKLYLTPFFTYQKLKSWHDFSLLIVWGSCFNQFVLLLSLFGIYELSIRKKTIEVFILTLPFLFFMLMFAYISPYNGRLRDSFYPVIVILAGGGMSKLIRKFLKSHHLNSSNNL